MKKSVFSILFAGALFLLYAEEGIEAVSAEDGVYTTITIKKFTFSYKVTGENLAVRVSCQTKGWISVGFNPVRKMKGGNFIVGYTDGGQGMVRDDYGNSPYSHKADTGSGGKNDILESSCTEEGNTTTLTFTIPLNSGDDRDVALAKGKNTTVILAAGKVDNLKKKHFTLARKKIIF